VTTTTAPTAAASTMPHVMGVYGRTLLAFERGEGVWLYSTEGEAYLDCVAGIATNGLGHANPVLVQALTDQAHKLWHISNIYRIPEQETLAKRLTDSCFADVVFFANSGAEAVECALKTARKYHAANGAPERVDIIGFDGSFHGRTYATINASGNYVRGVFGDWDNLKTLIGPTTAAVIIEPVQGEGGARSLTNTQLEDLRAICDEAGILLIFDEIQCGMGRTGKMFAYEWSKAEPDIMCIAKALGGGFPIGACLATAEAAKGMTVGAHGSTFGGNPLAMAVGIAAYDELAKPALLDNVGAVSGYLRQQIEGLKDRYSDIILDVRGKGLLIGVKVGPNNRDFMVLAREHRLLIAGGGDNCVRLLPPLNMTIDEAQQVIERLEATCKAAQAQAKSA
jgi:acetylornithine/N-succinyldiaminopimelate aminotransferase